MISCVFVTFPFGVLGQVWYLTVLIPDICLLLYLKPPLTKSIGRSDLRKLLKVPAQIQPRPVVLKKIISQANAQKIVHLAKYHVTYLDLCIDIVPNF